MTWILYQIPESENVIIFVSEWSDSQVEQAAENIKKDPKNYGNMIDVMREFVPDPIKKAL